MLKPVGRGYGSLGEAAEVPEVVPLGTVGEGFRGMDFLAFHKTFVEDLCPAVEFCLVVAGVHGDEEGNHNAGHSGVDAAVVEQEPHYDCRNNVVGYAFFSKFFLKEHKENHNQGYEQQRKIYMPALEEGHHKYGNEVIGNGKGRQEHLQRHRNLVSKD